MPGVSEKQQPLSDHQTAPRAATALGSATRDYWAALQCWLVGINPTLHLMLHSKEAGSLLT